ncbi:hypothetical protein ACFCYI_04210 [Streptomyces sp. NPDC056257]|uniref:hypothetical protein n=1 Tax=Streptomyces sp. NPDC056257 TaxID=3345765 RepID=UPI0035E346B1
MGIETFRSTSLKANEERVTPVVPGSFSVVTQMMQDAVRADGVSVGEGDYNQESLFSNPFKGGRDEALVINAGGRLTYLERTDTSDTGWVQGTLDWAPQLAEVVAVAHPSGVVYGICSPEDGTAKPFAIQLVEEEKGDGTRRCTWKKGMEFAIGSKNARSLCVSYTPDAGPVVLGTSLTPGGSCFVLTPQLPSIYPVMDPWALYGSRLAAPGAPMVGGGFLPFFPATGQRNVYVYYFLLGTQLTRYEESAGQVQGPYLLSNNVNKFCGSYYVPYLNQDNPQGDVGCAWLDDNYLVATSTMSPGHTFEPVATSITGVIDPEAEARIWQDADGRLHLFANSPPTTEGNWDMRVLHQATWQTYARGHGPNHANVLTPEWTSARVAGAPAGIGGYDLLRQQDRLVAFDYTGEGRDSYLFAYRPVSRTAWVIGRTQTPGGFEEVFESSTGLPGFDLSSSADQVVAYDYNGTKSAHHLLAYRPGAGKFSILAKKQGASEFQSVVAAESGGIGEPGNTYDLASSADRIVPFDYRASGANDCLLAYRPGTGIAWVLVPQPGGTFHPEVKSGNGLGGFTLSDPDDIVVPLDFGSTGSNTHLLGYRPGTGMAYILAPDGSGGFTAVVRSDSGGIGSYDLSRPNDRLLPFDFTGAGKNDHILAYRPGVPGQFGNQTAWVLKPDKDAVTRYSPVLKETRGLGGYDFASPADLVTGYDYRGTGSLAYLVAYRPGTGKVSVMGQRGGKVQPVYQAPPAPSTLVTVGLHRNVSDFQLDPYPDYKPSELIKMSGLTDAEAYCICTQDITTSEWQTDKVRVKPDDTAEPFVVSHYVADATLLSVQGTAMREHNVTVSAESLVEVQIEEVSYQVGPGRAVSVTTNNAGKLAISIAARGLNPPIVHLNADGLEAGQAIDFASQANSFLAGEGTLPSQKGMFSPELLHDAKCTSNTSKQEPKPLADWTALKERGLTPHVVVDHCSNMYSQAAVSDPSPNGGHRLMMALDGAGSSQPVYGYVIQLWDEDRPAFQVFRSQEEVDAYRAYRGDHPAYGGWWEDFTSWSSDVWEGIKTGAQRVAEVIVTKVVEIAVWIGNAVVSLGQMIIDGIEAAVRAVEAVFQMIADAIMRVIDWLKSLFNMKTIWDTKEALETGFASTSGLMTSTLDSLEKYTDGWIKQQKEKVRHTFQDLIDRYDGTRMADFQNKVDPVPAASGTSLERKDLSTPQGSWFVNKTLSAPPPPPADRAYMADFPLQQDWDHLVTSLTGMSSLHELIGAVSNVDKLISDFFTLNSDDQTGRSAYATFMTTIRDFILGLMDAVDDILKAFIAFAKKGTAALQTMLDYPFPLPVVDTLYKWVQTTAYPQRPAKDMTLGGFAFLVAGFFVTTIHKLINGVDSEPFPAGFPTLPGPPKEAPSHDAATPAAQATSFDDPLFNQQAVAVQATGVPWAVLQFLGVGLTDIMAPVLDEVFKAEKTLKIINCTVAVVNGYQGLVLGCPPILGSDWTALSESAYALTAATFFLDFVGSAVGDSTPFGFDRSTLLKNWGIKWALEKEDNISAGSVCQCLFAVASTILQCIDLKQNPPTTRASTGVAWVSAAMSHAHNILQVIRVAALKMPQPPEPIEGVNWKNTLLWGTTIADALVVATGDFAVGVPACIALNNAPRITNGGQQETEAVALPDGKAGVPYTADFTVTAAGGDVPLTSPLHDWHLVDGPGGTSGLQIKQDENDVTKATFAGTPVKGTYTFSVRIWDSYSPKLCSYSGGIPRVLAVTDKPYFKVNITT